MMVTMMAMRRMGLSYRKPGSQPDCSWPQTGSSVPW
jgi:hypothetical protein